nr:ionotropic receptor 21a [Achelura yunnanensis]
MGTFHIILVLLWVTLALSQEIEYYPSQSEIKSNDKKNKTPTRQQLRDFKVKTNHTIRWRQFSDVHGRNDGNILKKRAIDPVFHGHPKTREELWHEHFLNLSLVFDQTPSLVKLIHNITLSYLIGCIPVILYDSQVKSKENYLFQNLLKNFPVAFVHGYINNKYKLDHPKLLIPTHNCHNYIVFLSDVAVISKILGKQADSKIVVVARSSQWAVQEFLVSPLSRMYVNLLVIGQSFKDEESEAPYILYTHKLYTDGLGTSKPLVLTSWTLGKYSRNVNLFPFKMTEGYAGHRFLVAAANQPPFVFKNIESDDDGGNPRVAWDGIEIRLLHLLAEKNNFSIEIVEPRELRLSSGDAVSKEVILGRADIGIAGLYITNERVRDMDISVAHSQDCAAFVTLMSTALPRYRAILGPFHWHVWVALIFTYLIAIFPLAFSDKHTLRHLLNNSGEVENMFWYVFGTFTNCFTFVGKNSWSKTTKNTTRLLIGWYWVFTIIITSCYTGSIIAFVTLPIFPATVDSINQLLSGFYRIGTLDRGGWERWFINSSDPDTNKLFKKIELVSSIQAGIKNTTKAFFFPYAFFGSKAELKYIVQANFSNPRSKRAVLHVSNECFVPFGVALSFPTGSIYTTRFSDDIGRVFQSGILEKIVGDVKWEMQRSSTGKLLSAGTGTLRAASVEEKGLTLEDTQGMFLLLGAGFVVAAGALISEWMGGISRRCCVIKKKSDSSSANSSRDLITPFNTENDVKFESDDIKETKLEDSPRNSSADSMDTLDGQIIKLTENSIILHENFHSNNFNSRRSSSADINLEISDKDLKRQRMSDIELQEGGRLPTASKGNFGGNVSSMKQEKY